MGLIKSIHYVLLQHVNDNHNFTLAYTRTRGRFVTTITSILYDSETNEMKASTTLLGESEPTVKTMNLTEEQEQPILRAIMAPDFLGGTDFHDVCSNPRVQPIKLED